MTTRPFTSERRHLEIWAGWLDRPIGGEDVQQGFPQTPALHALTSQASATLEPVRPSLGRKLNRLQHGAVRLSHGVSQRRMRFRRNARKARVPISVKLQK